MTFVKFNPELVQAFINVAYVIGLAPVTGIQLPMISSGGTSAVITLASMGLLANCPCCAARLA